MDGRMTEIYRNCRFRLFSVTEIIPSPYGGRDFRWRFSVWCKESQLQID